MAKRSDLRSKNTKLSPAQQHLICALLLSSSRELEKAPEGWNIVNEPREPTFDGNTVQSLIRRSILEPVTKDDGTPFEHTRFILVIPAWMTTDAVSQLFDYSSENYDMNL